MPTLALKDFYIAAKQGLVSFTIVGQTVGSGGVLTDGTSGSLRGQFKRIKVMPSNNKENVSSVDSFNDNNLNIGRNLRVEISEMQRLTVNANVLPGLLSSYDFVKLTFAYGCRTYGPMYIGWDDFSDAVESKGNGTIDANFSLIDVGQTGVVPYTEA